MQPQSADGGVNEDSTPDSMAKSLGSPNMMRERGNCTVFRSLKGKGIASGLFYLYLVACSMGVPMNIAAYRDHGLAAGATFVTIPFL